MKTLAALALLALTQPAEACHRFSVWKYPYPQRCAVRTAAMARPLVNDGVYYPTPPVRDDNPTEMLRERLANPPRVEPNDLLLSRAGELHL